MAGAEYRRWKWNSKVGRERETRFRTSVDGAYFGLLASFRRRGEDMCTVCCEESM